MKITTVRRQSVQVPAGDLRVRCPVCGREVEFVSPARAAEILSVAISTLQVLIARGKAHGVEASTGAMWICADSLGLREQNMKAGKGQHRPGKHLGFAGASCDASQRALKDRSGDGP